MYTIPKVQAGPAPIRNAPVQLPEDDDVVPKDSWNWEDIRAGARRTIIGAKKNIEDPAIFHKIALFPLLAWIGLGADGVSSSSYGPPEAFIALGEHTYLAVFLALGTALTVFIISYAYTRIIEHFPSGGGGYIVATHTISERAGVVSGSALLIDYMLTITVSIAACGEAVFSFLPFAYQPYKLAVCLPAHPDPDRDEPAGRKRVCHCARPDISRIHCSSCPAARVRYSCPGPADRPGC